MSANPFIFVSPATRGLSLALTRNYLRNTNLPVFATHRSNDADSVRKDILAPLKDVDPERLKLLSIDLTSEESIVSAASALSKALPEDTHSYIHTAFITGGVLHAEKNARDLDLEKIQHSFQINVISHLLLIKHFSKFLPSAKLKSNLDQPSKWIHVSARVGSVSDNQRGGWYSYRSSKSALNQVIKTFDLQLKMQQSPAISVGVHPGTVKTALSEGYLDRTDKDKIFEPEDAAAKLVGVVAHLEEGQRGRVWDWAGKEILP